MALRESMESDSGLNLALAEAEAVAQEFGLRYVRDRDKGFARKRRGKGFVYVDPANEKVTSDQILHRIKTLVIPPAWENVWICRFDNGHLQATGRDQRERKQYRYHQLWCKVRNETKFAKLALFGECLPKIRERLAIDVAKNDMSREMVLAAIVQVMEETMIRIGNDEYAEENDSYGLTTIRNHHTKVQGSKVHFKFRGKSGVMREATLEDKRLSKIIRRCQDLPGQELFAYECDDGSVRDVGSQDVNSYLKEITGEPITAKDFRTWGATVHAAEFLYNLGPAESGTKKEFKERECRTVKAASEFLGNTVAVCRKYYVHPAIIEADQEGRLVEAFKKSRRKLGSGAGKHLEHAEFAVLEMLKNSDRLSELI